MQFSPTLNSDAAALERAYRATLERLPATVHAFILTELQRWTALFAAEQRYQRALLEHLTRQAKTDLAQAVSGIARIEIEAGCDRIARGDPARFQDEAQALLRKRRLVAEWRKEVDGLFQRIDPALEAELYPPDAPRRLVVQLYGSGIALQPDRLWSRFGSNGLRIPLTLDDAQGSDGFLRALFAEAGDASSPSLFSAASGSSGFAPLDAWIIESHDALHKLYDDRIAARVTAGSIAGLSYDRLQPYRDGLTRALYSKIQSGVESPQAFAAYARGLKIAPAAGTLIHAADVVQTFVRDVFLTGNGTLFVNNTFVEWAAVQVLRRAQPRVLVARYGVRDKLKPFSSLLLFSQPRASDQIPLIEDPVGSFVDVEQLAYYVWLNAEKSPAYRQKTLYLFLAEGFDQMLAIRSDGPIAQPAAAQPSSLADVCATMAHWLGVPSAVSPGRVIGALVG